ncbi:CDP-alcohol phosphatidyltransferase family protein [Clostridium omnivorum]|uniref:CDP-alcohol phosphatidyltransferase n=1 Tax=Clostridium omnivorum TaxID=1604902 RepID=A0ABQ5N1K5_9CLOT|nr:CDP-alcohol phosphatidyltransferase family protein [Clostridium sp. E14]GLC29073.1 CDP-alcohol phosphatidyltransferase [Clostridium sp. E14]
MIRYVPNILSILRIILSLLLIPLMHVPSGFEAIYIVVGITDVCDGIIARRFGCESDLGAKLDSIADFVFYTIFIFIFLKLYLSIMEGVHLAALILIIIIRLINMLFTKLKYKKITFVHTIANKAAGFMLFFLPIWFLYTQNGLILWIVLITAFAAAAEELLITIKFAEPDLNRRSILF